MRIKKSNPSTTPASVKAATQSAPESNYSEAIGYIQSAISSLSSLAKTDEVAKESIANLGVVLLDLQ